LRCPVFGVTAPVLQPLILYVLPHRSSPHRVSRQPGSGNSKISERALIEAGERLRNARIRDWIEQSPQPKQCEQHKAWSSTSSDYDTQCSDLSAAATAAEWDTLPLSVSMRSLKDFQQTEQPRGDIAARTAGECESERAHKAYQELLQRYRAVNSQFLATQNSVNKHEDDQDGHPSPFVRSDTKENALTNPRPPLYRLHQTCKPPVARILDLQVHDLGEASKRADEAANDEVAAIEGLQDVASRTASASTAADYQPPHYHHNVAVTDAAQGARAQKQSAAPQVVEVTQWHAARENHHYAARHRGELEADVQVLHGRELDTKERKMHTPRPIMSPRSTRVPRPPNLTPSRDPTRRTTVSAASSTPNVGTDSTTCITSTGDAGHEKQAALGAMALDGSLVPASLVPASLVDASIHPCNQEDYEDVSFRAGLCIRRERQ
jgi:hypothetical protein